MYDIKGGFFIGVQLVLAGIGDGGFGTDENFSQNGVRGVVVIVHGKGDAICGRRVVEEISMQSADFCCSDEIKRDLVARAFLFFEDLLNNCADEILGDRQAVLTIKNVDNQLNDYATGVLGRPVTRLLSDSFQRPNFFKTSTLSKRLSTLRFAVVFPDLPKLGCLDI